MRTNTRAHARPRARTGLAATAALALVLGAAACADEDTTDTVANGAAETAAVAESDDGAGDEAGVAVFQNGWAKATDTEMSGVFGAIRNIGDEDLHLIGVTSPVSERVELHETVPGGGGTMMQEKEDGFVIPAGGELILEPGGDHIMLMDLTEPITTGQQINLVLEFDDESDQAVTVSARDFMGGEEEYVGDHGGHADHGAGNGDSDSDG